jgi:hypothetical protein
MGEFDRIEEFGSDGEAAARALDREKSRSAEVTSMTSLFTIGGERPFVPVARCPGIRLPELPEGEHDTRFAWNLFRGGGKNIVFFDAVWPGLDETLRIHIDMSTTCRRLFSAIVESDGHFMISGDERGQLGEAIGFEVDVDDAIFKAALAIENALENREDLNND